MAKLIGPEFQPSMLWGFEDGDDNDINGWSIEDFKKYCEILKVDPEILFIITISNLDDLNLNELIKARREEKCLTQEDLSDIIGYEVIVIKSIESEHRDTVVCIDTLKGLGKALDIPLIMLLKNAKSTNNVFNPAHFIFSDRQIAMLFWRPVNANVGPQVQYRDNR